MTIFEAIKMAFDNGWIDKSTLFNKVTEGKISAEEYKAICGEECELGLDVLKLKKSKELADKRDVALTRFKSSALGEEHIYKKEGQTDIELFNTVEKLLPLYRDETIQNWYVVDLDTFVPHTKVQIQQMLNDYLMHYLDTWEKYEILASAMKSAVTVEELNAVVWE